MQLGNILSAEDGDLLVGRKVEFHLLKKSREGQIQRKKVSALLLPVSEKERQESRRKALDYLRSAADSPYRVVEGEAPPPIPSQVLAEEEMYSFLAMALHDEEEPARKFVAGRDYALFRQGVIVSQINWLTDEYNDYIRSEYPEVLSPEQRRKLEAQAEENFSGGQP